MFDLIKTDSISGPAVLLFTKLPSVVWVISAVKFLAVSPATKVNSTRPSGSCPVIILQKDRSALSDSKILTANVPMVEERVSIISVVLHEIKTVSPGIEIVESALLEKIVIGFNIG